MELFKQVRIALISLKRVGELDLNDGGPSAVKMVLTGEMAAVGATTADAVEVTRAYEALRVLGDLVAAEGE